MSDFGDSDAKSARDAERAMPCVWMSAGVLSYKLCDRGLDCESCPLDAALRGARPLRQAPPADAVAGAPVPFEPEQSDFPANLLYHAGHLWMRSDAADRARCGLDRFAADLLPPLHSVILPPVGGRVRAGRVVCWLVVEGGIVPLLAPASGFVLRRNSEVVGRPALLREQPYDHGWLFEMQCDDRSADTGRLLDPDEARLRTARQRAQLGRAALARTRRSREVEVGPTLPDGGEPASDLRARLGDRVYLELLLGLLR